MFFVKAYWMYNVRSNGNCKINDTFATVPFPRAATFSKELGGLPLIIYNGPQCGETTYSSDWPLVYSIYYDVGWGKGVLSAINGSSSEAFYAQMFARLIKENNMNVFTQDFLDFQSLLFPEWLQVRDVTTPTPLRTLMVVIYPSPQNQNHGMWGGAPCSSWPSQSHSAIQCIAHVLDSDNYLHHITLLCRILREASKRGKQDRLPRHWLPTSQSNTAWLSQPTSWRLLLTQL